MGFVIIAGLLLWACLFGQIVSSRADERDRRVRASGEIVEIRESDSAGTYGIAHHKHVVVRTDDERLVILTDPPYRKMAVGNHISHGGTSAEG